MTRPRIDVFCDGSGTIAQGPACIGVVLFVDGESLVEASEHVGSGTNNVAELRAIRRAMYLLEHTVGLAAPATVCSDSAYALGIISDNAWFPNANAELVLACRNQLARFSALRLLHCDGHAGIFGNTVADWLAGEARARWFAREGMPMTKKRKPRPERKEESDGSTR